MNNFFLSPEDHVICFENKIFLIAFPASSHNFILRAKRVSEFQKKTSRLHLNFKRNFQK